jgi:hypothetical protein
LHGDEENYRNHTAHYDDDQSQCRRTRLAGYFWDNYSKRRKFCSNSSSNRHNQRHLKNRQWGLIWVRVLFDFSIQKFDKLPTDIGVS